MSYPFFLLRPDLSRNEKDRRLREYYAWQSRMNLMTTVVMTLALMAAIVLILCWRSQSQ